MEDIDHILHTFPLVQSVHVSSFLISFSIYILKFVCVSDYRRQHFSTTRDYVPDSNIENRPARQLQVRWSFMNAVFATSY